MAAHVALEAREEDGRGSVERGGTVGGRSGSQAEAGTETPASLRARATVEPMSAGFRAT
jgi:hypothetical protein